MCMVCGVTWAFCWGHQLVYFLRDSCGDHVLGGQQHGELGIHPLDPHSLASPSFWAAVLVPDAEALRTWQCWFTCC